MPKGNKTRIGILGGSFDPITLGHTAIAEYVLAKTDLDGVWIMPCNDHMIKSTIQAGPISRMAMCSLAVANTRKNDEPLKIGLSTYEIRHHLNGSVYDLFEALSKDPHWVNYEFSFIIGGDNVVAFDKWKNAEELKNKVRFIVVPRQGVKIPTRITWYKEQPHIFLQAEKPIIEVSSTIVRNMLGKRSIYDLSKKDITKLLKMVDGHVLKFIIEHALYIRGENEQGKQGRI